ncbi:hypothetical protein P4O66_000175 [Electrophorus voltai]|uniref:Reverse transcriptase domain-containing protein n=1 Tax=Electrophorus voltai TaxID=2609070 RepID=A0AAD8ZZV6_9TELE|nr:hypothetical protein P4O66_000175 [Electrophorus voltai]
MGLRSPSSKEHVMMTQRYQGIEYEGPCIWKYPFTSSNYLQPEDNCKISSAFNTIIPSLLTTKLGDLGLHTSLCDWISNFLTNRPQSVRVGNCASSTLTLSTAAPQGCVLSPLLYSLYTYDCTATSSSTIIVKFADDTVVVGLISDNDERAYLEEIKHLENWCQENNLLLNVSKTKELIVDCSKKQERHYQPVRISGTTVERVDSFRRLRDFRLPSKVLWNFYTCTIESILTGNITVWFGNSTKQDRQALQRVVRSAERITHSELPDLQTTYYKRCQTKARKIVKDPTHPNNRLFSLLSTDWVLFVFSAMLSFSFARTFPSVKLKFHNAATLPCNQTSWQSKEGFHMSHDQYLKGNLSLTITGVDYNKRGWYTYISPFQLPQLPDSESSYMSLQRMTGKSEACSKGLCRKERDEPCCPAAGVTVSFYYCCLKLSISIPISTNQLSYRVIGSRGAKEAAEPPSGCQRCPGWVTWTVFHKPHDILAQCNQTSCHSKEGFHMSHDQYLKSDLSLSITDADYTKKNIYTCECNGKDVCDVALQLEEDHVHAQTWEQLGSFQ